MTTASIPAGTQIVTDPATQLVSGDRLVGGTPARMLRLTETGKVAWQELQGGAVASAASGVLARKLTDAGLAHPRPSKASDLDVTVVVPAYGRADPLDRCLGTLEGLRVVVVDDGSPDSERVAGVVARHGARLLRRDANGGPAAARNTGIADLDSELIAFLDSDCIAPIDWLARLAGHFADPLVGAVAPRIVSARTVRSTYLDRCSTLDLGLHESRVHPDSRVSYVPTAALVVRRTALVGVGAFDADLRYGEDVDLVWRLDAAGWRVRYDPSVVVAHDEPRTWRERLARRYRYGSSAAGLTRRHPGALTHLSIRPLPLAAVAAVLGARPMVATAAVAGTAAATSRSLRQAGADIGETRATASVLAGAWLGSGRYVTQFASPLLVAALARKAGRGRRAACLAALVLAPPLVDWFRTRPPVTPARYVGGRLADDVAYGAGVYAGCLKERTAAPLAIAIRRRGSEQESR